jgi:parallel beta-helix repeat protein
MGNQMLRLNGASGVVERWNGSDWVQQDSDSAEPFSPIGAIAGGSTDATLAFQAAMDATALVKGRLLMPPGTFLVTSLSVPSNIELEGSGDGTVLTSATDNGIVLHLNGVSNVAVRGLKLTSTATTRGDGIRVTDGSDIVIERIHATGNDYGIRVTGSSASSRVKISNVRCEFGIEGGILLHKSFDCVVTAATCNNNGTTSLHHGIYISDTTSRRCQLIAPVCYSNTGSGIQVGGKHHEIIGGESYSNGTNGLVNSTGDTFAVVGLRCTSNTNRGILIDTGDSVELTGVECRSNGLSGLELKNSRYVSVTGGHYSENTRHGIYLNGSVSGESVRECTITGPVCIDNDSGDTSTYDGIALDATAGTCAKNKIVAAVSRTSSGSTKQRYGVSLTASCSTNTIAHCELGGNKTGPILDNGTLTEYKQHPVDSVVFSGTAVTLTVANDLVRLDASGGAITQNLPTAASSTGRPYTFKKTDASANAVTVTRAGSDTIDGATTFALATQNKYVTLRSNGGTTWSVVANN